MWIENVSREDAKNGHHSFEEGSTILIQIADPASGFITPKRQFEQVFQFEFLDIERDGDQTLMEFAITRQHGQEIVAILQTALDQNRNVVVHCHAGICRSGAVVEVGTMMGFDSTNRYRQPNMLVKHTLMSVLGWTYDSDESTSSTSGFITVDGDMIPFTWSEE